MIPLAGTAAGTKRTYVRLAIVIFSHFQSYEAELNFEV